MVGQLVYTRSTAAVAVRRCFIPREPTRCSRLAEHARHLGAVAARLGSEELRAQRRHVLGDRCWGGSMLNCALNEYDRAPASYGDVLLVVLLYTGTIYVHIPGAYVQSCPPRSAYFNRGVVQERINTRMKYVVPAHLFRTASTHHVKTDTHNFRDKTLYTTILLSCSMWNQQ